MDSLFLLGDGDRTAFLQQMLRSFRCIHICLWSYLPHSSNCLLAMDGLYREISNDQPSSSSGNLAKSLFDAYRESVNYVDTGRIPGFAFKNNLRYMELKLHDLQRMASHEVQLQFYQEAGIKTVVFMGCATGEIELGMSNDHPQVDLEKEMKNLFSVNLSMPRDLPNLHPPSSSSSSLRSLSVDSPELLFNNINPSTSPPALTQIRNINNNQLPMTEINDAAMTNAILASPSTESTNYPHTAFRRYSPRAEVPAAVCRQHSMFKRAVFFLRKLSMRMRQELEVQGNRPTNNTQLQHMISERKRREKLNQSFQLLRSLLPSGTKKDKTSVLSSTTEYLSSLRTQVAELNKTNQMLQMRLSEASRREDDPTEGLFSGDDQRINVEIVHVSSEERLLDLRVRVRSNSSMLDLVMRMLFFLKQQTNVSLLSIESNTRRLESSFPVHEIMMRLKTEGDEFDESGFVEAVKRVVDDQPH
ncbi:hypothetical protein CASFOL_012295 [Castilleja foliolosa]|uniref:BHLH domain-containing protein n=1 Tax=Castilleja foliolosa TaxID=1961234 RepID=A0ABD3DPZ8_9LAMI